MKNLRNNVIGVDTLYAVRKDVKIIYICVSKKFMLGMKFCVAENSCAVAQRRFYVEFLIKEYECRRPTSIMSTTF